MKKIITFAILFLFLGMTLAFADGETITGPPAKSAKIGGKVFDLSTGEALTGVAVSIKGSELVTYTDFDGNYTFENLNPGTYNIVASFISYKNSLIENVELDADENTEVIIQLQEAR